VIYLDQIIDMAKNWLLNSDVQQKEGEHLGAFNSWYDDELGGFAFAYPEITGYGITLLTYLYNLEKEEIYLQKAKIAANWILDKVIDSDGGCFSCFPYFEKYNKNKGVKYLFDSGIILNGIVNLYRETNDERYLNAASSIANWILNMQNQDGSFIPFVDKDGKPKHNLDTWSTQSGSYLAKVCIGLLNLYDITNNDKIKNTVIKCLNYSLKYKEKDYRFRTYQNFNSSNFHPHNYSSEAFFTSGQFLNNKTFLEIASKASEYLLRNLGPNWEVPRHFMNNKFNYNERSDIIAQTLRMALLSKNIGQLNIDREINTVYNRLIKYQVTSGEHRGAFIFGTKNDGQLANNPNSWCTMFALQSLILYKRTSEGKTDFVWRFMV